MKAMVQFLNFIEVCFITKWPTIMWLLESCQKILIFKFHRWINCVNNTEFNPYSAWWPIRWPLLLFALCHWPQFLRLQLASQLNISCFQSLIDFSTILIQSRLGNTIEFLSLTVHSGCVLWSAFPLKILV